MLAVAQILFVLGAINTVAFLALSLWNDFEEYVASKLREDAAYDRAHGDCFPIFDAPDHSKGDTL